MCDHGSFYTCNLSLPAFTLALTQSVLYFLLVSTAKEKDGEKFKNLMIEKTTQFEEPGFEEACLLAC